ncbi:MAG TPA: energy-coupling factor transporter ATPase [Acidimicrobiia bacterium]|nr:energy-coupling factor transporter ATPase [Acidimicrobiia bacterium]
MTRSPALVVEDYSFWFRVPMEGQAEPALENVSFEIEQGEFVLVLGRSGSGKSTLALNLVGIYPDYFGGHNQGRILVSHPERGLINRRELQPGERFQLVNMLFQNPQDQIVTLSVEEEVAFALENYLMVPADIHPRIDRALDLVGLQGFRERSTLKLSGGEKQRVALAAMLAMEPKVLILDEPTSNLDPVGTSEVLEAIDRIREKVDLTLLVIEHEVDAVFDRADRVMLVDEKTVHGPSDPRGFLDQHGLEVRDMMGLWIPQAVEVGLELRLAGISMPRVPLNGNELVESLGMSYPTMMSVPREARSTRGPNLAPTGDPVIDARDVWFAYDENPVLRGVNLQAYANELLAIVGQNGSGKSTLAQMFNGILTPDKGEVMVEGKATTRYDFADLVKRVAYIFQVPEKQFIRNTVYEEIAHGLKTGGLKDDEIEPRVHEFLEGVRLLEHKDRSPYVLSHGQKRRLSVACMVVADPDVIILDEPTFGQDYHQAQRLMQLLRGLADKGAAVVFITHDMRLVAEYADRCAVLADGEIVYEGTPPDLFDSPEVLARAKLKAPPIHSFSRRLVGEPLLDTGELTRMIREVLGKEVDDAQARTGV